MSKIAIIILGLLKEKPLNPYEITKVMNIIHISKWYSFGNSTIYATIKNLHKKALVEGYVKKEGNMPEKTIYSITEKGKNVFEENLIDYLSSVNVNPTEYNISCIFICHLQKNKVMDILVKRQTALSNKLIYLNDQLIGMKNNKSIPEIALYTIIHSVYLIEAEIKTTNDLIVTVKKDKEWNNFITKDLKL